MKFYWSSSVVRPSYPPISFRRFVYQVVVPKTLAPKELVKVFEGDEKVVLPPWDPLVSGQPVNLIWCAISLMSVFHL